MSRLALYGTFCLLAILVTLCAKADRQMMIVTACQLFINWLLFAMPWIYPPASLAWIVSAHGIYVHNVDMWSAVDLLSLVLVGYVGWRVWWMPVLAMIYLIKLGTYAVAWATGLQYLEYRDVLDMGLTVQLAILFMIGGGDCADYLLAVGARLRRLGRLAVRGFARSEAQ